MTNTPVVAERSKFAVLSRELDNHAATINEELSHLNRLFKEQLVPRCKTIGDALAKARGLCTTTADFYQWAEDSVGIRQRQVRTYLKFAGQLPAIEAAAEAQQVELTSMEQGLALLAPAKEEQESDPDSARLTALAGAVGRAKGAMTKAQEAIYEVVGVEGLDPNHRKAFEVIEYVLNAWASPKQTDDGNVIPATVSVESLPVAVNRQDDWKDEPAKSPTEDNPSPVGKSPSDDKALLKSKGLPIGEKPGKWTLAQLEEGLALCDDNQTVLAAAIGVSKTAISENLKRKRAKAEVKSPTEQASEPVATA